MSEEATYNVAAVEQFTEALVEIAWLREQDRLVRGAALFLADALQRVTDELDTANATIDRLKEEANGRT